MSKLDLSHAGLMTRDRRSFLKTLTAGTAALSFGAPRSNILAAPVPALGRDRSRVAIASGTDRRQMIQEIMEPFRDVIREGSKGKQIILKPNMVQTTIELCATHVDALRGILDFLKPIYSGQIIIAESTASNGGSFEGFKNYGYLALEKEYGVQFVDLNLDEPAEFMIMDGDLHPLKIKVCGRYLNPNNYLISVCRLKTHDTAIVTLSTKNIAMSAPYKRVASNSPEPVNFKSPMHGRDAHWLNYNMYQIIRSIHPQFAVLESVVGMEGNGPNNGTPVEHGVALAGDDFVAVDSIGAQLMGVAWENVGVLNYLAAANMGIVDRANIDIVGGKDPEKFVRKYKMHDRYEWELGWKNPIQLQSSTPAAGAPPAPGAAPAAAPQAAPRGGR